MSPDQITSYMYQWFIDKPMYQFNIGKLNIGYQ